MRLAEERNADLIVIGTRKKGFFERRPSVLKGGRAPGH
jgi:nucleotide-binding universal stress UspA family protein